MGLNISKGNMYGFVTHTWNPIKGRCSHNCKYCYMKRFPQKDLRLCPAEFTTDLGKGNKIFIGSGTDIFAPDVPADWLHDVIIQMNNYQENEYLIQSKNTMRMLWYEPKMPEKTVFCTTIESNRDYPEISDAPNIAMRFAGIRKIKDMKRDVMITIEPVMDFDPLQLSSMLLPLRPIQINIGADSKAHGLPEPSSEALKEFIGYIDQHKYIKLVLKDNLKRLMKC